LIQFAFLPQFQIQIGNVSNHPEALGNCLLEETPAWPQAGYNTKIAKEIGCSRDTVRTWVERYEETGDVLGEEGRGRKRITTEKQDAMIGDLMTKDTDRTGAEISAIMGRKGVEISPTTVRQRLKEQGWTYKHPLTKPLLKDAHRIRRLAWGQEDA